MFCGIVGDNQELIISGLAYVHATNIVWIKKNIITFDSNYEQRFQSCACLIKRGRVSSKQELSKKIISDLVGVASKELGTDMKKNISIVKRFKIVELIHTDKDIKTSGQEIIELTGDTLGLIEGYQDIGLYETIDFAKPVSGMEIGMMPSKLALALINSAIGLFEQEHQTLGEAGQHTIRDPFCGFGTTNFLANALGYHTIGSDINPSQAKINLKRRKEQQYFHEQSKISFFKQDVLGAYKNPLLRFAGILVTEGRLGPVVSKKTGEQEIRGYRDTMEVFYQEFFEQVHHRVQQRHLSMTICMTLPQRIARDISLSEQLIQSQTDRGRKIHILDQAYARSKHLIARQILLAHIPFAHS